MVVVVVVVVKVEVVSTHEQRAFEVDFGAAGLRQPLFTAGENCPRSISPAATAAGGDSGLKYGDTKVTIVQEEPPAPPLPPIAATPPGSPISPMSPREARPRAISAGPACRIADGFRRQQDASHAKNYPRGIRGLREIYSKYARYSIK